ncbi:gibberellin 2-oxidase [Mucidula mucida]|nr:gibberellin 2-oxidase [Mucidula mucida]
MPAIHKPTVQPWTIPPPTSASLDWAPLVIIDLSKFDTPGGKEALAADLKDAVKNWGFWTVVNTGISQEQLDRQLAIGNAFFKLPLEEKRKVACDFKEGNYFGYREPTRFIGNSDVKENMEMLNVPKLTPDYENVPLHDIVRQFHDEIAPFHRLVWENVIRRLFVLFAIILELPENYFVDRHHYDAPSEDHLRYMVYHPRSLEEDKKIGDQWSAGHTGTSHRSINSFTNPTFPRLQIRTPSNEWKWVKYIPGGITCNAADTLSFLTKHRPSRRTSSPDQAHLERLGLFYFVRPGDNVPMVPAPSPVLIREGLLTEGEATESEDAVKGYEYVRARVKNVHDRKTTRVAERNPDNTFHVKNLAVTDYYV